MSDQDNNRFNQQDASDQTEELTQAQQAGYGNAGGLDSQAQGSMAGVTGENDGSDMGQSGTGQGQSGQGQSGMGDQSGSGGYGGQTGTSGQGGSGITGGMGRADGMTGSSAGSSDDATNSLIEDEDGEGGFEDGDMTSLKSDMGDGPGSQSGAGAGSSGTGQRT